MRFGRAQAFLVLSVLIAASGCGLIGVPGAEPTRGAVPAATLVADGVAPVDGQLGGYAIGDSSVSSPWLPGAPITVAANAPLTVNLLGGLGASQWTAAYVPIDALADQPAGLGDGSGEIELSPLPAGRWSLLVNVWFDGGGSAAFYWNVLVEQP